MKDIKCNCDEWPWYVEAMKEFYALGYSNGLAYTGPQFKRCPFCGRKWGITGMTKEEFGKYLEEREKIASEMSE